jgi:hypothetical protein
MKSYRGICGVALLLVYGTVCAATEEIITADPLKSFFNEEYDLGSDYFTHGKDNTLLIRCVIDVDGDGMEDMALSELSIWGNRTGPVEIFIGLPDGKFRYAYTEDYSSTLSERCGNRVEVCKAAEYATSGRCTWHEGFSPPQ